MAWLTDVLERIVCGKTKAREMHTLLPWNWRPTSHVELAQVLDRGAASRRSPEGYA